MLAASLPAALLVALALAACGGGDDGDGDAAALKSRLLPPSEVSGYKLHRVFEWDDSIDLVAQGIPLSETTAPSGAVEVMEDAGFTVGAGEHLRKRDEAAEMTVLVASFASEEDARDAQAYVHREGLKLPCYASCTQDPSDMPVTGIPGAQGVQQLPQSPSDGGESSPVPSGEHPPGEPPPFVAYWVGFTVGKDLYLVHAGGEPGKLDETVVIEAARKLHRRVSADDTSS